MIDASQNPDFVNNFLDYSITILNKSPNSISEYNYDLRNFLKFMKVRFGETHEKDYSKIDIRDFSIKNLNKITEKDVEAYLSYLAIEKRSKSTTRARKASTIRIFFKFLTIHEKLLDNNPAQYLETPKTDKRQPRYLTLEDSQHLLDVAKDPEARSSERNYAILVIFLNCGLRLSELVGINIDDIKFDEQKMTVIGKGNKERTVYLNKACIDAINNYLEVRPKDALEKKALFLSERKQRIGRRTVQYTITEELKKAGLDTTKYSTHKLRHTAATLMYQYGNVDIRALQELLGHQSISTTEIYTHVENEQVRKAVESNPLADYK